MKTIIKIGVAVVILLACFNAGMASFNNYQFEDAVHEGLLFNPRASPADIVKMVLKTANDYRIPIDADGINVSTVYTDVHVDMTYTTNVVLVPGVYATDWTFTPKASTRVLAGVGR
jgi:hypothetical protein